MILLFNLQFWKEKKSTTDVLTLDIQRWNQEMLMS